MAELKAFNGTAAEMADMETKAKARKAEKDANFKKMRSSKDALWASRPAPSSKLAAPAGNASGKSMKGSKPMLSSKAGAVPSEALKLSRTGSTPAMQARGAEVKARMDALRKAGM